MDEIPKIVKCVIDPSLITREEGLRKELAVAVLYLIKEVLKFSTTHNEVESLEVLCQHLLNQNSFETFEIFRISIYQLFRELFSEGISWHKIATLFAFCHILATKNTTASYSLEKLLPNYISDELLPWINANGGWNGLIILSNKCNNGLCIEQDRNNEGKIHNEN